MRLYPLMAAAALIAATGLPALAGDAEKGAKEFNKCKSCHAITDPAGKEVIKGGKVGPNLWGVIGRPAAAVEGFAYGEGLKKAAAAGLVWDEALIAEYVKDPTKFIDTHGGEGKSKMTFKLAKGGEDVAAWLATMK